MNAVKPTRVYELYDGPKGPSCQSEYYAKVSRVIYHVAAISVKQAIFLCAKGCWYMGRGTKGILEIKNAQQEWTDYNGREYYDGHFKHRQQITAHTPYA